MTPLQQDDKKSQYLLYGNKLIDNDNTLKDFAKSLCAGVPITDLNKDSFKDEFMDSVTEIINDDISRTDIDYEYLMHKYRFEIGDLLYESENHDYNLPKIKFFGEKAEESFNYIINVYIGIHFTELVSQ